MWEAKVEIHSSLQWLGSQKPPTFHVLLSNVWISAIRYYGNLNCGSVWVATDCPRNTRHESNLIRHVWRSWAEPCLRGLTNLLLQDTALCTASFKSFKKQREDQLACIAGNISMISWWKNRNYRSRVPSKDDGTWRIPKDSVKSWWKHCLTRLLQRSRDEAMHSSAAEKEGLGFPLSLRLSAGGHPR